MNDRMHIKHQQNTGLSFMPMAVRHSDLPTLTGMNYQSGKASFAVYGSLCRALMGDI